MPLLIRVPDIVVPSSTTRTILDAAQFEKRFGTGQYNWFVLWCSFHSESGTATGEVSLTLQAPEDPEDRSDDLPSHIFNDVEVMNSPIRRLYMIGAADLESDTPGPPSAQPIDEILAQPCPAVAGLLIAETSGTGSFTFSSQIWAYGS